MLTAPIVMLHYSSIMHIYHILNFDHKYEHMGVRGDAHA